MESIMRSGVRSVLYFHGFASSPASAKITALRPLLEPHRIALDTPDLNVPSFERLDLGAIVALGVERARREAPAAIVGSSLGAIIALEVASRGPAESNAVPLVLIAPALGVAQRWKERLPAGDPIVVFNHARNGDASIHRAFFEQIDKVRIDERPPAARVTVIMGRHDETVPFDLVRERWEAWEASGDLAPGSKFVEIAEGDHSLVAESELIAREIRRSVEDRGR
jgi:pimeloyl-ACP methyl ester carboxylesterase